MKIWLGLVLASMFSLASCTQGQSVHPRPDSVPKLAFWVGGEDGGVFVLVREAAGKTDTYQMSIYNDRTGKALYDGLAKLSPRGGSINIRDPKLFSGWDGEKMLLTDGRSLEPVRLKKPPERR